MAKYLIADSAGKEEVKIMADDSERVFDLQSKIADLQKEVIEEKHNLRANIKEKVDGLREELRTNFVNNLPFKKSLDEHEQVKDELETLKGQIKDKVSRSEINDLFAQCLQGDSEACRLIRQEGQKGAEAAAPKEPEGLRHKTPTELMSCPDCKPLVLSYLQEHPAELESLLCGPDDDACRLQLKLFTQEELDQKVSSALQEREKREIEAEQEKKKHWI